MRLAAVRIVRATIHRKKAQEQPMTDPNHPNASPDLLGDLPLQPTGSGVADLEIAFEQMTLAGENGQDAIADTGASPADSDYGAIGGEVRPS